METTELRRSTLERKDRDELVTIATALGSKPPSRARKAEIVDLILSTATTDAATDSDAGKEAGEDEENGEAGTYHAGDEEEFDFGEVTTKGGQNKGKRDQKGRGNDGGGKSRDEAAGPGNRRQRRRGRGRDNSQRDSESWDGEPVNVEGFLDLRDDGYGFLRVGGFKGTKDDAYVSVKQVRQHGLRKGDHLVGTSRPANRNEKNPAMLTIASVNGDDAEKAKDRPRFDDLTPLFPDEKLVQEMPGEPDNMTARIIDLLCPIGKGQRGLIVSPPKAGKTTIMKNITRSIETNNPDVHLIVLLVDERPEEVTDMKRWLLNGEVAASTFDRPADEHTALAEITIERAKRMVESGRDVVIILDGITRLARAYNLAAPATGRVMSGGVDSGALYPPKKFFGAARNVEEGGSLTILATALVETGSKMDEVIFEEFKGTGNMELRLDRRSAERRIYPAIDVDASSTRQEELLFEPKQLDQVWKLRRVLSGMAGDGDKGPGAGLELLMDRLQSFKTNDEFLKEVAKGPLA
ncbi:MAG: transcription termination factor Rho [Acidimicrobiales bacterium]|nr:transcription termination factor Rho [Acidimicrobiales bacterium]RZV47830.1 MAG: transcription termination factor Rho [Acidimicrobiales bacterium]